MKVLVCLVVALAAAVGAPAEQLSAELPTAFDYHRRVGIPQAERIRRQEESASNPSRIINGHPVDITAHPYQVGIVILLSSGWTSMCGGSVLSNTRVLTAAHCWFDGFSFARHFDVALGTNTLFTGGIRFIITEVTMHEDWDASWIANDIAMISIPWVSYTDSIQPIRLPSGNELNDDFAGRWAIASGYGMNEAGVPDNQVLWHVSLETITNDACRLRFATSAVVQDWTLCTSGDGGGNICSGDSGGPLTALSGGTRLLIGVTSFGGGECEDGSPGGFARVTYFVPWIQQHL